MQFRRLLRHLFATDFAMRRAFGSATLAAIEQAIADSERQHGGEIRFAIEGSLPAVELWRDATPRERALQAFSQLGVWDTQANNGVLIYVSWADRDVEIIADRGLNDRVTAQQWADVCHRMEQLFAAGAVQQACVAGIAGVGALLAPHFPARDRDELSNRAIML